MCCTNTHHSAYLFQRTVRFCEQLATVIPNAHVYYRRGLALKRIIPQCVSRDFTYLMVINEDRKVPSILYLGSVQVLLYWFITFIDTILACLHSYVVVHKKNTLVTVFLNLKLSKMVWFSVTFLMDQLHILKSVVFDSEKRWRFVTLSNFWAKMQCIHGGVPPHAFFQFRTLLDEVKLLKYL